MLTVRYTSRAVVCNHRSPGNDRYHREIAYKTRNRSVQGGRPSQNLAIHYISPGLIRQRHTTRTLDLKGACATATEAAVYHFAGRKAAVRGQGLDEQGFGAPKYHPCLYLDHVSLHTRTTRKVCMCIYIFVIHTHISDH